MITKRHLAFEGFFELLRINGFHVGVQEVLRVYRALDSTSGEVHPDSLPEILRPVLCKSEEQQYLFDRLWSDYFAAFGAATSDETEFDTPTARLETSRDLPARAIKPAGSRSILVLAGILVGFILLIIVAVITYRPRLQDSKETSSAGMPTNAPIRTAVDIAISSAVSSQARAVSAGGEDHSDFAKGARALERALELYGQAATDAAIQRAAITWADEARRLFDAVVATKLREDSESKSDAFPNLSWPTLLVLSLFGAWGIVEGYRYLSHRLAFRRYSSFGSPLRVPRVERTPLPEVFSADLVSQVARRLRGRRAKDRDDFDIEATIRATIESCGFPQFRFRGKTEVPEYLVLIQRRSPEDHLAKHFEALWSALESNEVLCRLYFFSRDPSICWNEFGEFIKIADLARRFGHHRLMVFGDPIDIQHPVTGSVLSAATALSSWEQSAFFTPLPSTRWSTTERELMNLIPVFEGTLEGVANAAEQLQRQQEHHRPTDLEASGRDELEESDRKGETELIASCAVLSSLEWALTMTLIGRLRLSLSERDLLRLFSREPFRIGELDPLSRSESLAKVRPERETEIRRTVLELLRENAPMENSVAWVHRQSEIAGQEVWLARGNPAEFRDARAKLAVLPDSYVAADPVLMEMVATEPVSPWDLVAPSRLRWIAASTSGEGLRLARGFLGVAAVVAALLGPVEGHRRLAELRERNAVTERDDTGPDSNPLSSEIGEITPPPSSQNLATGPITSESTLSQDQTVADTHDREADQLLRPRAGQDEAGPSGSSSGQNPVQSALKAVTERRSLEPSETRRTDVGSALPQSFSLQASDFQLADVSVQGLTPPEAKEEFSKAITFGKRFAEIGDAVGSLENYLRADSIFPDRPGLNYNIAVLMTIEGRYAEARERLARLISLAPREAESKNVKALQLELDFQAEVEKRQQETKNYVEIFNRGRFHLSLGQYPQALESFEDAKRRHPTDPAVAYNMGIAYEKLGDPVKAVEQFRQYLAFSNNPPDKADVDQRLFRLEKAIVDNRQGGAKTPTPSEADPIDNFVNYETARVQAILMASTQYDDASMKKRIFEASMSRLQVLSNLKLIVEGAGAENTLNGIFREARDETARLALVGRLFGETVKAHWAPDDASGVVIEISPELTADPVAVLRHKSANYSHEQRRQAFYYLLGGTSDFTSSQFLWLSDLMQSFLLVSR